MTNTILSLDLGTHTGWALRNADARITSGTEHFQPRKAEGSGRRYLKFVLWLRDLLQLHKIDAVYFEQVYRHEGTYAAHVYGGLLGQLTALCEHQGISYTGIPVGTIKKFISGRGNASKEDVIRSVRLLGHDPCDDNEADALAILHFAMHARNKQLNQTTRHYA